MNENGVDSHLSNSGLVRNEEAYKHLEPDVFPVDIKPSLSSNGPRRNRKRPSSVSLSVEKIGPLFRRSNSVAISNKCASQAKNTNYSQSYPARPNHNSVPSYGSVVQTAMDINDVGDSEFLQTNDDTPLNNSNVVTEEDSTEIEEGLICGYTKQQFHVFISLVLLSLNDIMGYSAIAPFFPVVAADKGLNAMHVGIIFASYSMSGIIASIVVGIVLVRIGAKFCVLAGMFWNAGSLLCFGFLNQMSPTPFFVLSIASRCLMGFGSNTAFTAMFAIVFQEFDQRSITVLSLSEALVGVGGMIGPLVGGSLYQAGGYITPFMVLGSVQIVLLLMCWRLLPHVPIEKTRASVWPVYLLRHSSAAIAFLVIIIVFTVNSFIAANVSKFLADEFKANAVLVGLVFLSSSVFYAGFSPIWGYIADKWRNSYLMELGLIGVSIALVFVGPVSIIRNILHWSKQQLWLVFIAASVNGMFFGAALMPTFNEMILAANELKLKDSMLAQYGLVSGLWNMAFSIGDIAGPTLGGYIVEAINFQDACGVFAVSCLVLFMVRLLQRYVRYCKKGGKVVEVAADENEQANSEESKPLLADSSPLIP